MIPIPATKNALARAHAERTEAAARNRTAVLRRLVPGGLSLEALTRSLVQGLGNEWQVGTLAVLRELEQDGEVYKDGGMWFRGSCPPVSLAAVEPTPTKPAALERIQAACRARPGLTTQELAAAADCHASRISQFLREGRIELERREAKEDGLRIYRWYPPKYDAADPSHNSPSEPARAPESSTPEEAPARASVVAAQPGSGELGGVASPGAGASQAADRTREPEPEGAYPSPAADPCSPLSRPSGDSSTAAPAADRADLRADREGDGSGEDWAARRPIAWDCYEAYHYPEEAPAREGDGSGEVDWPRHVRDAYQLVVEAEAEVERLREADRQRDADRAADLDAVQGYCDRADQLQADVFALTAQLDAERAEVERLRERVSAPVFDLGRAQYDLQLVRESLDRIGVPAGELGWRLGWLEGRRAARIAARESGR